MLVAALSWLKEKKKEDTYQIKENSAGNVASTGSFIEVDIDAFKLEVALAVVLQARKGKG